MRLTENNAKFAVVKTAFHGGGILSLHISAEAAERAARKYKQNDCKCGCCRVVPITELAAVPEYDGTQKPYDIAK